MQVNVESDLQSVLAYVELFMKGEHLPPADGVWPRPGPKDPKEDEIEQAGPASDFLDNPSPSDHYLGFDASPASSSSATPSSFVDSLSTPVAKPRAVPENDASRKFGKTKKTFANEKPSTKTLDALKTTETAPKPAPKNATKKAKAVEEKVTKKKATKKKATKKKAQAVEEKATKKKRKEASDDDYSADSDEPSTKSSGKPTTSTDRRSERLLTKRSKAE